MDKVLL